MNINEFLKDMKAASEPAPAKVGRTTKKDEAMVITRIISSEGDTCVIDYNGMPYAINKKEIVDIEPLEGTADTKQFGQLVSLIMKKECVMECKLKVKVGDLSPTIPWV